MVARSPDEEGLRVRAVRDQDGKLVGFQYPDQGGRFISRQDAIERMRYSIEAGEIQDSFGNSVDFVAQIPIGKLWGIGDKSLGRLEELGIASVEKIRAYNRKALSDLVGNAFGAFLF